ncbi:MAG TPA: protease inhibitor I42 family protein [Ktedonobacterales bacterium]|nr:protease inhibitor I42 family protein [Ktedonobacterales bacterium]
MFSHRPLRAAARSHHSPPVPLLLVAITAITAITAALLAGCGQSSATIGAPGVGAPTTTTTTPPIPSGASIRPCPGPTGSASSAGTPALVFSGGVSDASGTAKVGDLIQVRLPTTQRWQLQQASASAVIVGQGGVRDGALNACVWSFRASASGQITLSFVGTALCDQPGAPCPQYARLASYTVTVK